MKASIIIQQEVIYPRDILDFGTYRSATTHPLGNIVPEHLKVNVSWIHENGSVLISPVLIIEPMTPSEFEYWCQVTRARAALSMQYNFGLNAQ